MTAPGLELEARHAARAAAAEKLDRSHARVAGVRLALVVAALALAAWGWTRDGVSWRGEGALAAVFVFVALWHERVERRRDRARLARDFYAGALRRVAGDWPRASDESFADERHPYARDLDVVGEPSLLARLDTCQTRLGTATLAGWLLAPADAAEVALRQAAARELSPKLDFREELAVAGARADGPGADVARAIAWAAAEPPLPAGALWRAGAALVAIATAALVAAAFEGAIASTIAWAAVAVQLAALRLLRERLRDAALGAEAGERGLQRAIELVARVEREPFAAPGLARRAERLRRVPAAELRRLASLAELLESRANLVVAVLRPVLLWDVNVALALAAWRRRVGPALGDALAALAEIEALAALGTFAHENPAYAWPEVRDHGAAFVATALAHPLLKPGRAVANDVCVGEPGSVALVTGSNMAGKSTLLRAVGCNAALALCGAPVAAASLAMRACQLATSMRVHDSLDEATSLFFAEVKRLKAVVELAGGLRPVLFLLDEILLGTNSLERGLGARAVVKRLSDAGAAGLVSTHDLQLAALDTDLPGRVTFAHFESSLVGGKLAFDYLLRPGLATATNALAILRAEGLVPPDAAGR